MEDRLKGLIDRCREGDVEAKGELVNKLMPLIVGSIRRYYFGDEELCDLIQDGAVKVLTSVDDFDDNRGVPFLGYIKVGLKYFYMEKGKRQQRELSLNNEVDMGDDRISFLDMLVDEDVDIEGDFLIKERQKILMDALGGLSDRQIKVIVFYFRLGLSMVEISGILGVHYQTVSKTKKLALAKMKKRLKSFDF